MNMVKSALRTLDLLELLTASPMGLGLSELARRMVVPKSSMSALLETLVARGYAARDGGGRYRLENAMTGRWTGGPYARLAQVARPVMTELVERTGETAFLGMLTPAGDVQYLDKVVSPKVVRYDTEITELRPAHATSIGKVLLAWRPEAEVVRWLARRPLARHTDRTLTDRPSFLAELARIRREGYAVNVGERVAGAAGVAAPVRGSGGRVIAAVNLSAPTARFREMRHAMTRAVLWGAAEMSRLLGGEDAAAPGPNRTTRRRAR